MKEAYTINRKIYKDVKKMDHGQMSNFLKDIYMKGRNDGMEEAEGLTGGEIKEVILGLKGIGEKRANLILEALEKKMEEKHLEKKNKK